MKLSKIFFLILILLSCTFVQAEPDNGMEQVIFGGYHNLLPVTSTEYNSLVGGNTWTNTESWRYKLVSTDGVIKNLRVKLTGTPGEGKKYTFTLMVNGNPTALTFEITDLSTTGSNMVNEIDVTGGDTVSLQCDPDGIPTAVYAVWTCVFEGDTEKESLILGGSGIVLSKTDIEYGQVMGSKTSYFITENYFRQVVPTSGTIKNFYVKLNNDPGRKTDAYRFTLRKNGVSQPLTVTITADDITGNDLINSFAVVDGDILTMMIEPLNTPANVVYAQWGMTFVADIDGESIVMGGSTDDIGAYILYIWPTGYELNTWYFLHTSRHLLGQVCIMKKLHILLSGAPGVGSKYDFFLIIAGADSNVVATVSGIDITGNSGVLEDTVALDEPVSLKCDPDGTPTVRDAYWGFVCYTGLPPEEEAPPVDYFPMLLAIVMCLSLSTYFLYVKNN